MTSFSSRYAGDSNIHTCTYYRVLIKRLCELKNRDSSASNTKEEDCLHKRKHKRMPKHVLTYYNKCMYVSYNEQCFKNTETVNTKIKPTQNQPQ